MESDTIVRPGSSIANVTKTCLDALEKCLTIPGLKKNAWAANRPFALRIWAARTGTLTSGIASLDSRLAFDPQSMAFLMSLLMLLLESVLKCQQRASEPESHENGTSTAQRQDPSDVQSPEAILVNIPEFSSSIFLRQKDITRTYEMMTSLERSKRELDDNIDDLVTYACVMEKRGSDPGADACFNPRDHQQLRNQLTAVVLAHGSEVEPARWKVDGSSLTPVQERLILANLKRRNRFLYAQRHAQSLECDPSSLNHNSLGSCLETDGSHSENSSTCLSQEQTGLGGLQQSPPNQALSSTHMAEATPVASLVETQVNGVPKQPNTPPQVAKTCIATMAAKIAYPRRPILRDGPKGLKYFRCPCCCKVLPELFWHDTHWKKHLEKDICPYTCILNDCDRADTLFVSRFEWIKHIRNDHGQCLTCLACRMPGKMPVTFPSEQQYADHLRTSHADAIDEEIYPQLMKKSIQPVPKNISQCPLCHFTGPADSALILDHIAEHLHDFSLRSLPWAKDEVQNERQEGDDFFDLNDSFDCYSENVSHQSTAHDDVTRYEDWDSEGLVPWATKPPSSSLGFNGIKGEGNIAIQGNEGYQCDKGDGTDSNGIYHISGLSEGACLQPPKLAVRRHSWRAECSQGQADSNYCTPKTMQRVSRSVDENMSPQSCFAGWRTIK